MESLDKYFDNSLTLGSDTLYELRILVARYPFYDAARILLLKNLYILHDSDFGKELRRSVFYLKDRKLLFNLFFPKIVYSQDVVCPEQSLAVDRTLMLIDAYLSSFPEEHFSIEAENAAAVDYVSAYISNKDTVDEDNTSDNETPALRGQELIDKFLEQGNEKIAFNFTANISESADESEFIAQEKHSPNIAQEQDNFECEQTLSDSESECDTLYEDEDEETEYISEEELENETENQDVNNQQNESLFSETLFAIYVQRGKYEKALEIIRQLNLDFPNNNRYFAHQLRFIEKIVNHTNSK